MFKIIFVLCFLGVVCCRLPGPDYYDEGPGPDPYYYRRTRGDKPETTTMIFSPETKEKQDRMRDYEAKPLKLTPETDDQSTAVFKPKDQTEFCKQTLENCRIIYGIPEVSQVESDRHKRARVLFNPDTSEILRVFTMPSYKAPYSPRYSSPEYKPAPELKRTCH